MQILGGGVNPYIKYASANICCFSIIKVNTKHYRYVVKLIRVDSKTQATYQFWSAHACCQFSERSSPPYSNPFPKPPGPVFKHSVRLRPSRRKSSCRHHSHDGQSPQRIHEPPFRSMFDSENLSSRLYSTVPSAVRSDRIPPQAPSSAVPPFPFLQPSATPGSFSAGRR